MAESRTLASNELGGAKPSYSNGLGHNVDGNDLSITTGIIIGNPGAGKTTLLKNLMTKEEREKHEDKLKTGLRNPTKEFPSFDIDVGSEKKVRIFDSPAFGVGDSAESRAQSFAMAHALFGEQEFSFIIVVLEATDARIGIKSQILKLILEEGVLKEQRNRDKEIQKKILIVGSFADRYAYVEELNSWKENIATKLLCDPLTNQPLDCSIVTTSITGRGTQRRPYDAKIDDVFSWLQTVPADIICGRKADEKDFANKLQGILGMQFNQRFFSVAVEELKYCSGIETWKIKDPEPEPKPEPAVDDDMVQVAGNYTEDIDEEVLVHMPDAETIQQSLTGLAFGGIVGYLSTYTATGMAVAEGLAEAVAGTEAGVAVAEAVTEELAGEAVAGTAISAEAVAGGLGAIIGVLLVILMIAYNNHSKAKEKKDDSSKTQ